jgi:hypothetical protein
LIDSFADLFHEFVGTRTLRSLVKKKTGEVGPLSRVNAIEIANLTG